MAQMSRIALLLLVVSGINLFSLYLYHQRFNQTEQVVTVDFKRLSEAKIGEWSHKAAMGQPTSAEEMQAFISSLHGAIKNVAGDTPVFVTGAIFQGGMDITEHIAAVMGINLDLAAEGNLSKVADSVTRSLVPRK